MSAAILYLSGSEIKRKSQSGVINVAVPVLVVAATGLPWALWEEKPNKGA